MMKYNFWFTYSTFVFPFVYTTQYAGCHGQFTFRWRLCMSFKKIRIGMKQIQDNKWNEIKYSFFKQLLRIEQFNSRGLPQKPRQEIREWI